MGSPKALLEYQGELFAARLIRVLSTVCDSVIVALGYNANVIQTRLAGVHPNVTFAVNRAPERGQLTSLQTALQLLPPDSDGFAFVPVDCPAVREDTVANVAAQFSRRDAETLLVVPSFHGKHGHPVFATKSVSMELLALSPNETAREVIHAHVPQTVYVEVDDPGILTDVDTPEAYRRLIASQ